MKNLLLGLITLLLGACCENMHKTVYVEDFIIYHQGQSLIDTDHNVMRVFSSEDTRVGIPHSIYHQEDTTYLSLYLPKQSKHKVKYLIVNYKRNRTDTLVLEYSYKEECKYMEWRVQKATLNGQAGVLRKRNWFFDVK